MHIFSTMMKKSMAFFLYLAIMVLLVDQHFTAANYELQVTMNAFEIGNQTCAICNNDETITNNQCCDGETSTADMQCALQCDIYFNFCQYPLSTPINAAPIGCSNALQTFSTPDFFFNIANRTFSEGEMFLGLSNPIIFSGFRWEGVQIYFEVKDYDFEEVIEDDLIDYGNINVDIPVGTSISHTTYTGRFNNAQVELSFRVVCAENYYGPDCTRFCNDSICLCDPDFTGEFCETNINDCEGVNCSGQGTCEDGINSFKCLCDPGFTGELCDSSTEDDGTASSNSAIIGAVIGLVIPIVGLSVVAVILTILLISIARKRTKINREKSKGQDSITVSPRSNNYNNQTVSPHNEELSTKETVRQLKDLTQTENNATTGEEREFKNPIYGMTDENGYEIIPARSAAKESSDEGKLQRVDSSERQENENGPVYVACPLYAQTIP